MASRLFIGESFTGALTAYVTCSIVVRLLGMVRGIVLTWLLVRSEYGLYQVTLLLVSVLMPLCSLGLNEAVARYVPAYEAKGQLAGFLRRAVPLVLGGGVTIGAGLFLVSGQVAGGFFQSLSSGSEGAASIDPHRLVLLTRLTAGAVVALVAYFLLFSVLRGLGMFRAVGLYEVLNASLFLAAVLVGVWLGYRTAEGVLVCYIGSLAASMVSFGAALIFVLRGRQAQQASLEAERVVGRMLRFSIWAGFAAGVWQILQHYPLWYLNKVAGPASAGEFGGVRQLAQVVLLGALAVTTVVTTQVTRTWESKGPAEADRQLKLAYKGLFLLVLFGSMVLAGMGESLVKVLGPEYRSAADILPSLLVFFVLGAHLTFLSVHFGLIEKTRLSVWPWLAGIAVTGILAYRWVGSDGTDPLHGAANAGAAGLAVAVAVCIGLLRAQARPFGGAQWGVLCGVGLLYGGPTTLLAGGLIFLILACFTSILFDVGERKRISDAFVRFTSAPGIGR